MKASQFCYWLQGLFELQNPRSLTTKQTELIRKHLALVFAHELDKEHGDEIKQQLLNEIHSAGEATNVVPQATCKHDMLFRC